MSKIKLLLVSATGKSGTDFHRCEVPFKMLDKMYPEDFEIEVVQDLDWEAITINENKTSVTEFVSKFDAVFFMRGLSAVNNVDGIIKVCRDAKAKVILDIDDHWMLSARHIRKLEYDNRKTPEMIKRSITCADYVWTTSNYLGEHINDHNKNWTVFPNALDTSEAQWSLRDKRTSPFTRFGWIGSIAHLEDIELLKDGIAAMYNDSSLTGEYQFVLGGFHLEKESVPIVVEGKLTFGIRSNYEKTFAKFERIFTDNYNGVEHPRYREYLCQLNPDPIAEIRTDGMIYKRVWVKDTYNYGMSYNEWDVSLCPLADTEFARSKSNLKLVESGITGKTVIASGVESYIHDIEDGVNGFLIPPDKKSNRKMWYHRMRTLIHEPEMRKQMAMNLTKTIVDKYDLRKITEKRYLWFKENFTNLK